MRVGILVGPRDRLAVRLRRVLPGGVVAVVVERRLAAHHQLDGAAHAAHGAQQDVLGVPVHRGASMGARPGLDVVPRPHHQRVADDHPAGVGLPGGLQDQAARQVAPRGGHGHPVRAQPEVAGAAVQDGAEHAGGVGARDAQPFHRAGRRDQAGVLAVGQERVVGDRRKGVPQRPAGGIRHRCRHGERGFRLADVSGPRPVVGLGGLRRPVGRLGVLQDHSDIIDCREARRLLVSGACPAAFRLSAGQTPAHVRAADRSRRHIPPRCAARAPCWRSAPKGAV